MQSHQTTRQILLLSTAPAEMMSLFNRRSLAAWRVLTVKSTAEAALVWKHHTIDLVLVDESLYVQEGLEGIVWLFEHQSAPIVLLSDAHPEIIARAYRRGISWWLPHRKVLHVPNLLASALERVAGWSDVQRMRLQFKDALERSEKQVDRLIDLLWRSDVPDNDVHWYSHRQMLQRLTEETCRAERHQTPLSLAIAELQVDMDESLSTQSAELANWTAARVSQCKRRCDIAGQYGLHGFMMLLTHTPAEGAIICCKRIQSALHDGNQPWRSVRAYFGLASYSGKDSSPKKLLHQAEEHLAAARRGLHGGVVAD